MRSGAAVGGARRAVFRSDSGRLCATAVTTAPQTKKLNSHRQRAACQLLSEYCQLFWLSRKQRKWSKSFHHINLAHCSGAAGEEEWLHPIEWSPVSPCTLAAFQSLAFTGAPVARARVRVREKRRKPNNGQWRRASRDQASTPSTSAWLTPKRRRPLQSERSDGTGDKRETTTPPSSATTLELVSTAGGCLGGRPSGWAEQARLWPGCSLDFLERSAAEFASLCAGQVACCQRLSAGVCLLAFPMICLSSGTGRKVCTRARSEKKRRQSICVIGNHWKRRAAGSKRSRSMDEGVGGICVLCESARDLQRETATNWSKQTGDGRD